jgi:hypothetical protein
VAARSSAGIAASSSGHRGWEPMKAHANRRPRENPNGILSPSPGLRGTSYPGKTEQTNDNPNGVVAELLLFRRNPARVDDQERTFPRVARSSQPWAGRCKPFGIGRQAIPDTWKRQEERCIPKCSLRFEGDLVSTGPFSRPVKGAQQ